MMVVVVSGSRSIVDFEIVKLAIESSGFDIQELVHGEQPGVTVTDPVTGRRKRIPTVDLLSGRWAKENRIHVKPMPADWVRYLSSAGPIRNGEMLHYAVRRARELGTTPGHISIWDGVSTGTLDAFKKAQLHRMETCRATVGNNQITFEYFNSGREKFFLSLS